MKNSVMSDRAPPLALAADIAADLMTPNPHTIAAEATVREAVAFLTDKGYSAAPVIDRAGRPVGVLSRADLLRYDRDKTAEARQNPEYYTHSELTTEAGEPLPDGFQVEVMDRMRVRDVMTPVVYSVRPETPVHRVVEDLVALRVHRLFVVDREETLVGVISVLDVLRHLTA
jgi:CBS-domain-containing membrane protein